MPIQHAVLALLQDGPSYGYELKGRLEEAVGPQFGDLNIGHLYQILDRLVRDGLVTRREVEQSRRPDKVEYDITRTGADELQQWLEQPFVRQTGYRDDFFLKLFAAAQVGAAALDRLLTVQREAYLQEAASLAQLRRTHRDDPLVALLIEAALLHVDANLKTLDATERHAAALTAPERRARRDAEASPGKKAAS
jgi:DNA-binding PadR family transcriptional regulator